MLPPPLSFNHYYLPATGLSPATISVAPRLAMQQPVDIGQLPLFTSEE